MTEKKSLSLETGLFLGALTLALAVRLIGLGIMPFNETEASWAWQAYQVSRSEVVQIGSQPAYVLLTSLIFFFFSSSEALARLLPAVFGAMVVLLPIALKHQIGKKAALIMALGLALDPIMVAVSRQAGGPMLAVGFAALAIFFWLQARVGLAGVFTALFLLSGLPAVPAFLGVLIAVVLLLVSGFQPFSVENRPESFKPFWIGGGLTLVVVGTLWMRYPLGLSAMVQAIPDYLYGWSGASAGQVPSLQLLAALPVYQPVGLLFALVALLKMKTWEQASERFVALLSLVLLSLIVIYPSRQVADLVWVLPLIWLLAGSSLAALIQPAGKDQRVVVWGQAMAILAMLSFWWANIVKATRTYYVNIPEGFRLQDFASLDAGTRNYLISMVIFVIVPIAVVMLGVVVITGWSKQVSLQGSLRGLGIFAIFYLVMVLFGIADLRTDQVNELWSPVMSVGYADDLRDALAELSEPAVGNRTELEVVYQLDMDLLRWQLRDMPNARYAPILDPEDTPAVLINDLTSLEELSGTGSYRGEKIAIQLYRAWGERVLPQDFDRWFVYRDAPVEKQWITLWARDDIFVGYSDLNVETGEPVE